MKDFLSKTLLAYTFIVFIVIVIGGLVLSSIVTNYYVLIAVLISMFIIFTLLLFYVFDKYFKPIEKVSQTMDKLLKGNYRTRIYYTMNGTLGELSSKVNALARNLSDLTIQEQIQAEQLSTVIDNSESALVLIDEKGYIHVVNRKFLSMFGGVSSDYIGFLYYDVLKKEQIHHTVQDTFLYEKNIKHSFSIEDELNKRYLEIVGAPIFNDRGLLRGAVLVIYDITEFKKLEVMRKDFVANVSHELKTPITSIKGFSETLLDGAGDDPETRHKFLKIINDESQRIKLLIDDLLILSKLEKDELEIEPVKVSTAKLFEDIHPIIEQKAKAKDIHFDCILVDDIIFEADLEKVRQILINLLANAINYTSDLGTITLQASETEDEICLTVSDTGIGMSKDALSRIFERFYRVDKARSRDTGGTGLGLAIVKHIVEVHQGRIEVESELGEGTTFKIYLPKSIS
ncbi:MAG TPA: ATP-binding protein [Pseudogracilibacillus sp.]|nr:ATP-binding protein [Pseudogracilibacillus sp.]